MGLVDHVVNEHEGVIYAVSTVQGGVLEGFESAVVRGHFPVFKRPVMVLALARGPRLVMTIEEFHDLAIQVVRVVGTANLDQVEKFLATAGMVCSSQRGFQLPHVRKVQFVMMFPKPQST